MYAICCGKLSYYCPSCHLTVSLSSCINYVPHIDFCIIRSRFQSNRIYTNFTTHPPPTPISYIKRKLQSHKNHCGHSDKIISPWGQSSHFPSRQPTFKMDKWVCHVSYQRRFTAMFYHWPKFILLRMLSTFLSYLINEMLYMHGDGHDYLALNTLKKTSLKV